MELKYPAALVDWAGHGRGGVRQPFAEGSGRPTGRQIVTPLVRRLKDWTSAIANGVSAPRIILLVGGPGNGKTDAIEGCIADLDEALGDDGVLRDAFRSAFSVSGNEISSRKVLVVREGLANTSDNLRVRSITLIQDATEEDPEQPGKSSEQLLLEDLLEVLTGTERDIYLCCVNRGILSSAARIAEENDEYSDLLSFIQATLSAVTNNADSPPCWPLDGYDEMAVWPMDVESLVEVREGSRTVAHQVFDSLLRDESWVEECAAGALCPFCENKRMLSVPRNLDSLIKIMYRYELLSGKRWSFRDLFSFIAYLLAGDFAELKIKGNSVAPCEWAAYQLEKLSQSQSDEKEVARAPFLLVSKLYYHRLFPLWPRFNSKRFANALKPIRSVHSQTQLQQVASLFDYLRWLDVYAPRAAGDLPDRVRSSVAPNLDPALISDAAARFIDTDSRTVELRDLEDAFSAAIKQGVDVVTMRPFPKVEQLLLARLREADEALDASDVADLDKQVLRAEMSQFAIRMVKRSLATRIGLTKDATWLDEFGRLGEDADIQRSVTKALRNLLQKDGAFRAAVATTFGQPVAQRSKDVAIEVTANTSVKMVPMVRSRARPKSPMSFISVQGQRMGVTFALFKALRQVSNGLSEASLPAQVYALLDRVKAAMSGRMVREDEAELKIVIEGIGIDIEVEGGHYSIRKRGSL